MRRRGAPFRGILFAGLMMTEAGPQLLEYNVGSAIPRPRWCFRGFSGDLLRWLCRRRHGRTCLEERPPFARDHALAVVMAAQGLSRARRERGDEIARLARAAALEGVEVFHAGTKRRGRDDRRRWRTRAGHDRHRARPRRRARERAYAAVEAIEWPSGFYRRDIGARALERSL